MDDEFVLVIGSAALEINARAASLSLESEDTVLQSLNADMLSDGRVGRLKQPRLRLCIETRLASMV